MAETMTPKFWQLTYPLNQRPLERAARPGYEETPCPATGRHATLKRVGDLRVIPHPLGLRDFTWTWLSDMLISPRALALFQRHRITGFEVRKVEAEYPKPIQARAPELYEVMVTGWAGWPAREAGLSVLRSCPACGDRLFSIAHPGHLIDPTAWDGSDIFIVWPLPRYRFVSDRLARIIRHEKLSGAKLLPLQNIRMKPGAEIDAGSLLQWMPEERATLLRQQFGVY
jgi:hypothetical protein